MSQSAFAIRCVKAKSNTQKSRLGKCRRTLKKRSFESYTLHCENLTTCVLLKFRIIIKMLPRVNYAGKPNRQCLQFSWHRANEVVYWPFNFFKYYYGAVHKGPNQLNVIFRYLICICIPVLNHFKRYSLPQTVRLSYTPPPFERDVRFYGRPFYKFLVDTKFQEFHFCLEPLLTTLSVAQRDFRGPGGILDLGAPQLRENHDKLKRVISMRLGGGGSSGTRETSIHSYWPRPTHVTPLHSEHIVNTTLTRLSFIFYFNVIDVILDQFRRFRLDQEKVFFKLMMKF